MAKGLIALALAAYASSVSSPLAFAQSYTLDRAAKAKIVEAVLQRLDSGDARGAATQLLGIESACESKCSPEVLATLRVYLGLSYARLSFTKEAEESFTRAFTVDPEAAFDDTRADDATRSLFYTVAARNPNARPHSSSSVELWATELQGAPAARPEPAVEAPAPAPAPDPAPASGASASDEDEPKKAERNPHVGIGGGGIVLPEVATAAALQLDVFVVYREEFDARVRGAYVHVSAPDSTGGNMILLGHLTRWFGSVYGLGFGSGFGHSNWKGGWDGSSGMALVYATPATLRFGRRTMFEVAANIGVVNYFAFEARPWGYFSGAVQF